MKNGHKHEKIVKTFDYHGARVDLVEWDDSIWCGKVGYAVNNIDEPDVENIAETAQLIFPKNTAIGREENWEVCISLNYLSEVRPNGVMFGFLVDTEEQPIDYDIIKVKKSLYMKIQICNDIIDALEVEPWTGGIPPYEWIGEKIAPELGYTYGDDTLPIVEYYKHNSDTYDIEACYLYVPVQEL